MAIDAEQSPGNILQKSARFACSPEIVSPTAGDAGVAGSLVRPSKVCLAFSEWSWTRYT